MLLQTYRRQITAAIIMRFAAALARSFTGCFLRSLNAAPDLPRQITAAIIMRFTAALARISTGCFWRSLNVIQDGLLHKLFV